MAGKIHSSLSVEFEAALVAAVHGASAGDRKVAVFDADGTLWDRDIGEAFLRWLIAGDLLKGLLQYDDVYKEYEARVAVNRCTGYGWAVQVMKGLSLKQVRSWARQLSFAWPTYRPAMAAIIAWLQAQGVETWIVSASNQIVVEEAGDHMGIPRSRVRGIRVQVDSQGLLTDDLIQPITCNQGKVELIKQDIQVRPILAFGDSMGDLEMLEYAVQPMVTSLCSSPNQALLSLARSRVWPVQTF